MKTNTLGVAALFAASAAVHAQSNVQIYGIVDAGLLYQNKAAGGAGSGLTFLDGGNSPSIYGLRGSEDLGGGLKAGFNLEGGFASGHGAFGNSNGGLFGRNATVSVSGGFGSVKAGLQMTPFFLALDATDPRGMSQFGSGLQPYLNRFGITGLFDSNTVVYSTPTIGGFSASFGYAPGEVAGSTRNGRHITGSFTYANGPLLLNAAFLDANDPATGTNAARGRTLGAGYTVGALTVKASLTNYRTAAAGSALSDVDVVAAGADYRLGPAWSINGAVYAAKDQNAAGNKSLLYALGADYLLSRRTTLYGQLGAVRNEGAMQIGLAANAPATYAAAANETTTGVNIGIRHRF